MNKYKFICLGAVTGYLISRNFFVSNKKINITDTDDKEYSDETNTNFLFFSHYSYNVDPYDSPYRESKFSWKPVQFVKNNK